MTKETMVSLDSLDLSKKCSEGYEFEVVDVKGEPMGIFMTILGSSADAPKKAIRKRIDLERRQNDVMTRKGKDIQIKTMEELEDINNSDLAHYVVSWRGISEPCEHENICKLFKINSDIRRQVFEESEKLENFTGSK